MRARAALSALFAWAIAQGLTEANPVVGTSQPAALRPRERVLSDAELIEVWKACGGEDDCERIIRLLVLTACRRAEVGGMRWSELDSERGTWTIPGERTKNGRTHTLPLPPMAWEIIEAVPHRAGIDCYSVEEVAADHVRTSAAVSAAGPAAACPCRSRTAATRLGDLGTPPHVIEAVLNHASGFRAGVAGTYNRALYQNEMRAALAMWADHIRSLVEGGERKIVQLPARA